MGTGTMNAPGSGAQPPREQLGRADALEAAAVRAYRRRRTLEALVLDAARRADAAARLDAALRRPVAV